MRNFLIIVLAQLVCVLAEVGVQQEERSNGRPVYSTAMKSNYLTFTCIAQWLRHLMRSLDSKV